MKFELKYFKVTALDFSSNSTFFADGMFQKGITKIGLLATISQTEVYAYLIEW